MSDLERFHLYLVEHGVPHAVIGAAALGVHGVVRATLDFDLLTTDRRCLARSFWAPLIAAGWQLEATPGDETDPLAGAVRGRGPEDPRPLDLIIGRSRWEAEAVGRAEIRDAGGVLLPVVRPADLVALKLFAGSWKDGQDVAGLLEATPDRQSLVAEVEILLARLPREARGLWQEILSRQT